MPAKSGFPCPGCRQPAERQDTRHRPEAGYRYRRYRCPRCRLAFATYETTKKPERRPE